MNKKFEILIIFLFQIFLFNNYCNGQNQNHKMILGSLNGKMDIEIKEGAYIKIIANQQKIKGRLHIINDSLIELDKTEIVISHIDKLRRGHLGINISLASTLGTVSTVSFLGAITLLIQAGSVETAGLALIDIIVALPFIAIAVPTLILTLKSIKNCQWRVTKDYKITLVL